jgi:hypothetical protein
MSRQQVKDADGESAQAQPTLMKRCSSCFRRRYPEGPGPSAAENVPIRTLPTIIETIADYATVRRIRTILRNMRGDLSGSSQTASSPAMTLPSWRGFEIEQLIVEKNKTDRNRSDCRSGALAGCEYLQKHERHHQSNWTSRVRSQSRFTAPVVASIQKMIEQIAPKLTCCPMRRGPGHGASH